MQNCELRWTHQRRNGEFCKQGPIIWHIRNNGQCVTNTDTFCCAISSSLHCSIALEVPLSMCDGT